MAFQLSQHGQLQAGEKNPAMEGGGQSQFLGMRFAFPSDDDEADSKKLDEALAVLKDHFDTVHIFATRHKDDGTGTEHCSKGCGNWFARYGHIKDWITGEEESTREKIRKVLNPPNEDG